MKSIVSYLQIVFISCWILLFPGSPLFSENSGNKGFSNTSWKINPFERKAFIENKGQLSQTLPIEYQNFSYSIDNGTQILFNKEGLTYVIKKYSTKKAGVFSLFSTEQKREELEHQVYVQTQYVSMKWVNANPDATIENTGLLSADYNYVMRPTGEKPVEKNCKGYSKIVYKNLYNGIDVEYFFTEKEGFKYNIIAQAGADLSQVKMQYTGANGISLKNGTILIKTIIGTIIDHAPSSFYTENTNEKINSSYSLNGNNVSFTIENPAKKTFTIDPWTVVPGLGGSPAYDNGVDAAGNVYVYGGSGGINIVEKYTASGTLIWSLTNGTSGNIGYGDMLVEQSGDFYLAEAYDPGGAHTYKFSSTSAPLWTSTTPGADFKEHWRLALNCITGKVIVAGGGTNYTMNIAEVDVSTGVLTNIKSLNAPDDISGLCVDDIGKSYTHGGMTNKISFNDATNNPVGVVSSGYTHTEAATAYYVGYGANGYNMMALGGSTFLFTSDGATVKKWDRNSYALLGSATIPGGQQNLGSGILADKCNNLFVGASNGVYRFDFNLVQKEFQPTSSGVFDIAYALNSEIVACGTGFLTPLPFGREACGAITVSCTSNPCDPEINTVIVTPTQGVPPFTYYWDDGNTDSIRTNLSMGIHIVTVRDGSCNPSFNSDTVKISNSTMALTVQKINPVCELGDDGEIVITLLGNQLITNVTWTPVVADTLLNDSTTKATGLQQGTYSCHIESSLGCSFDTTITLVAANANPAANFDDVPVCDGNSMPFTDISTTTNGTLSFWSWDFGDGSPVVLSQNSNHVYPTTGSYQVTLTVANNNGCTDTIIKNVIVHPLPKAKFSAENVCKGSILPFTDLSTLSGTDMLQIWAWDFGDGSPVTNNQNTLHLYSATGNYTAQLLVISNFGCRDSVTKVVTINPNPLVNFTAPDTVGCNPLCVNFQNSASVPGGNITSFVWNLGNGGAISQSPNPEHCYTNNSVFVPLTFDVTLTVTSDSGCITTFTKNNYIIVNPNPIANFSVDPDVVSITNPVISVANLSSGDNAWNWNFGDLTTASIDNPLPHTYADTGRFVITLIVSNQYACFDTTYKSITVEPDWAFFIPNVFSPNGDGINDYFQGIGFGLLDYKMEIFDRWGDEVYVTKKYDSPWNGKANGGSDVAQQDVYVYVIQITDVKKVKHNYKGIVTLIK